MVRVNNAIRLREIHSAVSRSPLAGGLDSDQIGGDSLVDRQEDDQTGGNPLETNDEGRTPLVASDEGRTSQEARPATGQQHWGSVTGQQV